MEDNLIHAVCERLSSDKCKLENKALETIEVDSFNLSDFWSQFGVAVQSLSNEVTKVSFVCGKSPFPRAEELNSMLGDLMQHYGMMRDLYQVLPEEVGATVYGAVTSAVLGIMSALLAVIQSLSDISDKGAKERLTLTSTLWDACNTVETLPRNNLTATMKTLEEETALAIDAQEELATAIEEDGRLNLTGSVNVDNSELWTNEERELANRAMSLVKVTQLFLRKLHKALSECGSCATPQHCAELDMTVQAIRAVSPALDDFVSELYHPIHICTALENAGNLAGALRNILSTVKDHHFAEGINKDMDKLLLFISHNHNRLDPNAVNPVPELECLSVQP